ncbi:MAG: MFS transporter [Candidatus Marinimicrobia bacterium]|nr:MFS transporter [Candidatus Neomarinimicrobiota bacterium]
MKSYRSLFIAACIGMLLFGIVMISLGTINTFLALKLALDEMTIASLAALLPLGILIGSLIFGPVVDRFGYKIILTICSLLILIAIEGIALAQSFAIIQLFFLLIGIGGGAINGSTNALVADISTEHKSAKLSLLGVFYGIGALGMPAILGILSNLFDYKAIVQVIGLLIIFPITYFLLIKFPDPKQKQGFPLKDGLGLLKERVLILIGIILFFESGMEGIVNNWTTTFLQQNVRINSDKALFALSGMVIALTLTRLVLGKLLKNFHPHRVLTTCLGSIALGTIILMSSSSYFLSIVGLIFIGIGFAAGFPVMLGYVSELYPNFSGTAFSIVFTIALIGNTLMNYLVGIIAHYAGIQHFLTLILISVLIMSMLLIIILRQINKKITL